MQPESFFHSPCSLNPNCSPSPKNSAMSRNPIWFAPPAMSAPSRTERLNLAAFYEALHEAKGVRFGEGESSSAKGATCRAPCEEESSMISTLRPSQ